MQGFGRFTFSAILILGGITGVVAQELQFGSFEDLKHYADEHSLSISNAQDQQNLAAKQTLAARLNAFNFKPLTSFSLTDNTQLNVLFIPAEVFGGPTGTFREIKTGQQYISNFSITPTIDLINPQALGKIKSAKAWEEVTAAGNDLLKRQLYENLAASYYNLLALQQQIVLTRQQESKLDSIISLSEARKHEGLIREQELNLIEINRLNTQNKTKQLEIQYEQQLDALKLLLDIPTETPLSIKALEGALKASSPTGLSMLNSRQKKAQLAYYQADLRASKVGMLPTLSLFGNYATQQNTNNHFLDNSTWIQSSYIGLRLSVPLIDFTKTANVTYLRISTRMAEADYEHSLLQDSLLNRQLRSEIEKSANDVATQAKVLQLRTANHLKTEALYREGLVSMKELLDSANELLIAEANLVNLQSAHNWALKRMFIHSLFP